MAMKKKKLFAGAAKWINERFQSRRIRKVKIDDRIHA